MRPGYDLLCFSHQRWSLADQRRHQLLRRFARDRRVFFFEGPVQAEGPPRLELSDGADGVRVCTPTLPPDTSDGDADRLRAAMLRELVRAGVLRDVVAWYCSPAALTFSASLRPVATVYDCAGHEPTAPAERERDLLRRADLVFTDGVTPFATARPPRARVYAFPNAVEVEHFGRARAPQADPDDQIPLPGPRLGLLGPVDRRLDLALLDAVARARPGWQLVAVGPVARDLRAALPRRPNLHFLGPKSYAELPRYLAGWQAALIPLVRGGMAPRACPSKALEYLAAGRPVVATSCLGELPREARGLVRFADDADAFVAACEQALADAGRPAWFARADAALAHTSWDRSFRAIDLFVDAAVVRRLGLAEGGPRSTAPSAPLDASAPDEANAASAAE